MTQVGFLVLFALFSLLFTAVSQKKKITFSLTAKTNAMLPLPLRLHGD